MQRLYALHSAAHKGSALHFFNLITEILTLNKYINPNYNIWFTGTSPSCHARVLLSGIHWTLDLMDSRQKHAGMTNLALFFNMLNYV